MKVIGSCYINSNEIRLNDNKSVQIDFQGENWTKNLYTALQLDYPKFYKMDNLAKMAFLSSELLKQSHDLQMYGEDDLALIFANRGASSTTDIKYTNSYESNGSPSPSLFVYTLPNILTGELAIRNKWYGENIFFIQEKFNPEFYIDQINFYLSKGSKACLCGWVESYQGSEECFLFLVEKTDANNKTTIEELTKLYNGKDE